MWRKLFRLTQRGNNLPRHLAEAHAGNADDMFLVGKTYLYGDQDVAAHAGYAAWWMEKAARAGCAPACVHAARLAWDGFVPDVNVLESPTRGDRREEDAFAFARLGHGHAEPEASLFLAWLLDATKAPPSRERVEALKVAAAHGLPLACVGLADIELREGASPERMMELLRVPLEVRLGVAHYMVAVWYGQGGFLPQDASKARHHLEIAADGGHVQAMGMLGECLMVENHKAPEGDADATARLERLRRLTRGETLLRKAASAENGRAACVLGDYWATVATPPDLPEAMKWYERGVLLGNAGAMYMSARLVLTGRSHHISKGSAKDRMRQAARAGHKGALALMKTRQHEAGKFLAFEPDSTMAD
ncbi:tetratricopeptide repeat protein [Acetobacter conturbans]|uniref:Sel1 repeat family protein n=1 Tax=Acetobacter conturbans TaxID=1737472 RepID=A0ABX0K4P2_9PROT|nr:SEL1-like repeat protein [Acetobacter conturbans]NHN89298.1 sel1 repeat family protein [Acetobacter conturbans]